MAEIRNLRENVDVIEEDGRIVYLIGTAHVSHSSVELAEEIIREIEPDTVAVELCDSRYASLKNPDRWKNTDLVSVIREGKAYVLMAQLMLAAFQKKLGEHLQIKPGSEMMRAVAVAEETGARTVLIDRDVRVTLKRTWSSLGVWSMLKVLGAMFVGLFSSEKIEEEEIERLKSADALEELMRDFSEALPDVRRALIDERDQYLAVKIRGAGGKKVVAVVGAGHVPGIKNWYERSVDIAELELIPKPRLSRRVLPWALPLALLALIFYGFYGSGLEKGWDMLKVWFWINAGFGALGALIALGHPLTVLTAFLVSPFTSANPFVAAGWIAGLVEATIRKPRVADLETIADDITTVQGIWGNRVSKVLLVICLTNLFGTAGTFLGIERMWSMS